MIYVFIFSHNNTQEIHDIFQVLAKFYLRFLAYEITDKQRSSWGFIGFLQSEHWITETALLMEWIAICPNVFYAVAWLFTCLVKKIFFFFLDMFFLIIKPPCKSEGKFYFNVEIYSAWEWINATFLPLPSSPSPPGNKSTKSLSFGVFSQMLFSLVLDVNYQNHILQLSVCTHWS